MVAYLADTAAVMAAGRASVASFRRPFEASVAFRELKDSPSEVRQACQVLEVVPCWALVAFPMEIEDSFDRQASALVACRELAVAAAVAVVGAVVAFHCCWAAFC